MSIAGPLAELRVPVAGRSFVAGWRDDLAGHHGHDLTEAQLIDEIRELEELKAAAAAAQARLTARYDAARRLSARPVLRQDPARLSRVISAEIALARRVSPARGQQHLGVALALVKEMPHTMAALTREDREQVDRELARDLPHLGDRKLGDRARAIAYRLDPGAAMRRIAKAQKDRRVTVRPAPDTMVNLTGLLPVGQGVAAYAALRKHAESMRAAGDGRTIGQIMADTLVARLTGQAERHGSGPNVELQLVMHERSLVRGSHEPAQLSGYGPIPAFLARRIVREADKAWVRRMYAAPGSGELVAMDSRRRRFTGQLRDLVVVRDQTCRNTWCDAPVRHADHVDAASDGGPTSAENGQGLCEACNHLKREWRADVTEGLGHVVELTTWTGHRYRSSAPPLPGAGPPGSPQQLLRRILDDNA